jgi:amino acid transporter
LAEFILPAILVTHLMRNLIRHYHWLDQPVHRSLTKLLPLLLVALLVATLIRSAFPSSIPFPNRFFAFISEYSFVMPPWLILYIAIHHVRYTREIQRKKRHLECIVKEKHSASADPAIDVRHLTGKLDHIRSLIDNDPNSARREITTFSRLLRSGYLKS